MTGCEGEKILRQFHFMLFLSTFLLVYWGLGSSRLRTMTSTTGKGGEYHPWDYLLPSGMNTLFCFQVSLNIEWKISKSLCCFFVFAFKKPSLQADKGGREESTVTRGSRKVLQDDSGRLEGHFYVLMLHDLPIQDIFNIIFLHQKLITVPNGCLQENSDRKW